MATSKERLTGAFGSNDNPRFVPDVGVKDHPSGSDASLMPRVHSAVREPVATRLNATVSVEPGGIRIGSKGGSMRATCGLTIESDAVALLLSFRASVRLLFTSRTISNSCSPSSAMNVALKVSGPPSPLGETGSTSENRFRVISFPFINKTASTFSSLSMVPMLENCPVTVT